MILARSPLIRLFVTLWCIVGAYTFTADGLLFTQHTTEDVVQMVTETDAVDAGEQTGTAEIRVPHFSATAIAVRNPIAYDNQAVLAKMCIVKPHRLSHIEYCGKKMVRSIMLQFHPREAFS